MTDLDAQLDVIDAGMLAPLVRKGLNRDRITVEDWTCAPMAHGVINPVTAGLYQVTGTARDGEEQLSWSLILKVIHWVDLSGSPLADGYMNEPGDWNYWKREALVFQSGILDEWSGDLVPVKCYDVVELPDDSVWLWLEHVHEPPGATWSLERHVLAARHFGQFGGAHCEKGSLRDFPWLCPKFLRQWVRTTHAFGFVDTTSDPAFWEHPLSRLAFPTPIAGRVLDLVDDVDRLLAQLERQPQTLAHLDTHHANLYARRGDQGQAQTVVIDWSFLGIAAVGEDLGMQVSGNLYDLTVDPAGARPYYEAALEAYVTGLRHAGWRGAPQVARFASATAASLRCVPYGIEAMRRLFDSGEEWAWANRLAEKQGTTVEEALKRWGQAIIFFLDLADDARQLVDQI
jgi:hypothetical protein